MDLIPVKDAVGREIQPNDVVVDGTGRVYVIQPTENSFRRQTALRAKEAHVARGQLVEADAHCYILPQFTVVVDRSLIPYNDKDENKRFYQFATKMNKDGASELLQRHVLMASLRRVS